jgi:hypothetical protein
MGSVAPTVLPHLMPSRPVLSRGGSAWNGVDLYIYRHPPAIMDHPEMEVHSLVIHMAGKVLVQDTSLRFRRVGWADAGCVSLNPRGDARAAGMERPPRGAASRRRLRDQA